ncbi:hypothetical protein [Candidatus Vondammii sp. HM_W22]|uniref:hypothetical protein n=1 Tax=Candidatus Vondammii sp. HM_W22 TaxID=2687299 RepID=UPI001F13A1FD|nr:hypothetical protein [Candidatus Vondammii sp. HM_W22]
MKFAHYDDNGNILGFYDNGIHIDIPEPNILLSEKEWKGCVNNPTLRKIYVASATLIEIAKPEPSLDDIKHATKIRVNDFTVTVSVRAKLTGYADQYKLAGWNDKSQRANRVITNTASDADIAILQTECDKRGKGETPQDLAKNQAAKGQALATAVAIIDGMESAALAAIESKRSENTLAALLD